MGAKAPIRHGRSHRRISAYLGDYRKTRFYGGKGCKGDYL